MDFLTGEALEHEDFEDKDDDCEGLDEDDENDDEEVSSREGEGAIACLAPTTPFYPPVSTTDTEAPSKGLR